MAETKNVIFLRSRPRGRSIALLRKRRLDRVDRGRVHGFPQEARRGLRQELHGDEEGDPMTDPQPQIGTCPQCGSTSRDRRIVRGDGSGCGDLLYHSWHKSAVAAPQARPAPPLCQKCGQPTTEQRLITGKGTTLPSGTYRCWPCATKEAEGDSPDVAGEAQGEALFSDDDIRRSDIPKDAFGLIHDLCYDHEGRDRWQYMTRAQNILRVDAGAHPAPEPPKGQWNAEEYRRANDVHESAERIIRRVVGNVLKLAHLRHDLDELVEDKALMDEGIALALGDETGCLDPESLSAENCEVLYVEKELRELMARAVHPSQEPDGKRNQ